MRAARLTLFSTHIWAIEGRDRSLQTLDFGLSLKRNVAWIIGVLNKRQGVPSGFLSALRKSRDSRRMGNSQLITPYHAWSWHLILQILFELLLPFSIGQPVSMLLYVFLVLLVHYLGCFTCLGWCCHTGIVDLILILLHSQSLFLFVYELLQILQDLVIALVDVYSDELPVGSDPFRLERAVFNFYLLQCFLHFPDLVLPLLVP